MRHMPIKRSRKIIKSFESTSLKKRSLPQKAADWLTGSFGTIGFLLLNIIIFTLWILINSGKIPSIPIFDPFPYVFLITFVSLEAIILAIVVLISQNRENQMSALREELQIQIELIAEKELTKILFLLKKMMAAQGIKYSDDELDEMLTEVDTSYIERKLQDQLGGSSKPITRKAIDSIEKVGESIGKSLKNNK